MSGLRRYFITGGTGFLGSAIVRKLLAREDVELITLLTRGTRPVNFADERLQLWKGDITACKFPDAGTYTHLIHAAADANDLLYPDQFRYYYTLVEGSIRVFDWGRGIPSSTFVSSGAAVHRATMYGRAKRLCEKITPWPATVVRVYSLVGENMPLNGQYALGRFLHQAYWMKRIRYYGGEAQRSYLHVDDAASWIMAAIEDNGSYPYEIGGSQPITVKELAHLVGKVCGVPVEQVPQTEQAFNQAKIYLPDAKKTMQALGVKETVSLEEAIRRTYAHVCRSNMEQSAKVAPFSLFDSGTGFQIPGQDHSERPRQYG